MKDSGSGKRRKSSGRETVPFWRTKRFQEMAPEEWESLCDGCAICCLEKQENPATGEVRELAVSCPFLDPKSCRCTIYAERETLNPECLRLTPMNIGGLSWLPETCAYRLVAEGRDLEWWHPLISRSGSTVHKAGVSVRGRVVSGKHVHRTDLE